jgi:pSer/pThr/pTyr-binding forkhead associated (FHA) protein
MPFALQVIKDNTPGEILPLAPEGLTLGRSSGHLLFEDVEISGLHCSIKFMGGELILTDHGSRNGTFVNGSRVEKAKLKASDEIRLGEHQFRVIEWPHAAHMLDPDALVDEWLQSMALIHSDATQKNMIDLIDREIELCIQDLQIRLKVLTYDGRSEVVKIAGADVVLGRAASIPFLLQDEELSRKHARLSVNHQGRLTLEDLNSANGTFVNEEQVHGHRVLKPNDCVRIGKTQLRASLVIPEFLRKA